jgi:hypothetical protein
MTVMTTQHHWVKHTVTPVSVLSDEEGYPVIFVDPDQQIISEDDAAYGCDHCGVPLAGHFGTKCEGEEID